MVMHKNRMVRTLLLAGLLTAVLTATSAAVPKKMNYQGRLMDVTTGGPVVGSHDATFRLFDSSGDGNELWSEAHSISVDSSGVFAVILGGTAAIEIPFDGPVWLEIEIDGEILSPRREIVSVPYAFRAEAATLAAEAESLGTLPAESYVVRGETASITAEMIVGGHGSGLNADMVDSLHADALSDTGHVHDGRYYTRSELETPGAVNAASNPVDWTKLKNVPGGFADGSDDVGGSGDGHSLDAADGTPTDALYVDNDGDVGVGTTTPAGLLHLARNVDDGVEVIVENTDTGPSSSVGIRLVDESGEAGMTFLDNGAGLAYDQLQIYNGKPNGKISFLPGGSASITMTEKGHLGIGHNNAIYPLHVLDTTSVNYEAAVYVDAAPNTSVPGIVAICGRTRNDYPSIPGAGVYGDAIAADGAAAGVEGDAFGATGRGVYGWARHASGVNYGVYGRTSSSSGYAGYFEGFKLPTGGAAGKVLTSDASGTGTWQAPSGDDYSLDAADGDPVDAVYVDNDGKVGIGTTSPNYEMQVHRTSISSPCRLQITNGARGSASTDGLILTLQTDGDATIVNRENGYLGLGTNGSELLNITSGSVGIGQLASADRLHITGSGAVDTRVAFTNATTSTGSADGLRVGVEAGGGAQVWNYENTYLRMGTNNAERLRIANDGKVGIGTTSPGSELHLHKAGSASCYFQMTNGITGSGTDRGLTLSLDLDANVWMSNNENGELNFGTNDMTRMSIQPDGKVGIGESNPTSLLDLKGSDPYVELNTTNVKTGMKLQKNGSDKWELGWNEGSGYVYFWSGGGAGTSMVIKDASGYVGLGTSNPGTRLDVAGDVQCVNLHETSDARLKTDVQEIAGVLARLDGVRGVTYRWNEEAGTLGADVGEEAVGVIAQELEREFPQLVSTSEGGYKSVEYGGLTAVLLEAVKELKAENEVLKQRIDALEAHRQ
jgi:hypothetical protein